MKHMRLVGLVLVLTGFLGSALVGCTSTAAHLSPVSTQVSATHTVLGQGKARACGVMLFQLIPIAWSDRVERARAELIQSRGGTDLIDPVIQEQWYWAYVMNIYCADVSGTVIR
jgi:hypothetical protein